MFSSADVLRFADKWFDRAHPDCIDRQGRLFSCLVLVTIFHMIMSIAFVKMEEWEKKHRHPLPAEIEIAFSGMIAPPEFKAKKAEPVPQSQVLIPFKNGNPGSKSGAKAGSASENAVLQREDENSSLSEKLLISKSKKVIQNLPNPFGKSETQSAKMEESVQSKLAQGKLSDEHRVPSVLGKESGLSDDANSHDGDGNDLGDDGNARGDYGVDNAAPGEVEDKALEPVRYVDIAPYRKEMLLRIAANWKPESKKRPVHVVVLMTLAKDGTLLRAAILESNSNRRLNQYTLDKLAETEFAPLPESYQKDSLTFKIELRNTSDY